MFTETLHADSRKPAFTHSIDTVFAQLKTESIVCQARTQGPRV
jgi:hypothetical protein